ncbi:diacylglycerol kinase family protein [soil metagenome]
MAEVLILSNPKAGRGKSSQTASQLAAVFRAAGYLVRREIDAQNNLPDAAIVIGGDGTLRYAAAQCLAAFGDFPPFVVIPGGTANLMAQHLKLNWDERQLPQQVLAAVQARKIQLLDAAKANDELFLLIAGIGFDAAIVAALDRVRTGPITMWSYVMPALQTIWESSFLPLSVEVDGVPVFGPAPGMVFVGNVKEYGTGFPVLPLARSDDGVLDVCILPCSSHEDLLRLALHVAAGEHPTLEGAKYMKARRVSITAKRKVPVQLDGDSAGMTPVDIKLLPIRVPFIVRGTP